MSQKNQILEYLGNCFIDDRGYTKFVNDFNFNDLSIKRFYIVENYAEYFIRAWHAHKNETKAVLCLDGAAMLCRVKLDNFESPSKKLKVEKFILESNQPRIIVIPKGYANGLMSIKKNSKIIFFSDKLLNESLEDDFRYEFNYWDPWKVDFR